MSLADELYEANTGLDLSSPVAELVNKALEKANKNRDNDTTIYQLYVDDDNNVCYGHQQIEETERNIYILTDTNEVISKPLVYLFWPKLKEKLPKINPDILQISNNLYWDKSSGDIINLKEVENESQISTKKY